MHLLRSRLHKALLPLIIFAAIGSVTSALAQAPPPEQQYTILGISVTGNRTGDLQTIIGQSGLYKGQHIALGGDAVHTATEQLWASGIFSDVQITVDKTIPQGDSTIGLFLTIHVTELPHLAAATITGNKEIKTTELEKALGLRAGD